MLCFGKSCFFRFNNPSEAKQLKRGLMGIPNGVDNGGPGRTSYGTDAQNGNHENGETHNSIGFTEAMDPSRRPVQLGLNNTNSNHNALKSPLEESIEAELREIMRQVSSEEDLLSETYVNKYALSESPEKPDESDTLFSPISGSSTNPDLWADTGAGSSGPATMFPFGSPLDLRETAICDDDFEDSDGTNATNDYQPPVSAIRSKFEDSIRYGGEPSSGKKLHVGVTTSPLGTLEHKKGPHSPSRVKLGQSSLYSNKTPPKKVDQGDRSSSGSSLSSTSLTTVTSTTTERESSGSDQSGLSLVSSSSSEVIGQNVITATSQSQVHAPVPQVTSPTPNTNMNSNKLNESPPIKREVFLLPPQLSQLINEEEPRHTLILDPDEFEDPEQKELCVQHMQAVAQRKKEQEAATLERLRMEEILSICAEYEEQIKKEKAAPKPSDSELSDSTIESGSSTPREDLTPTSTLEANTPLPQSLSVLETDLDEVDFAPEVFSPIPVSESPTISASSTISATESEPKVWVEKLKDHDADIDTKNDLEPGMTGNNNEGSPPPKPPRSSLDSIEEIRVGDEMVGTPTGQWHDLMTCTVQYGMLGM